ncbi:hypothetical protein P8452_21632 [Trifolium repens]|nr:hypothetical protein P8452_21632 [Trifolium repens]
MMLLMPSSYDVVAIRGRGTGRGRGRGRNPPQHSPGWIEDYSQCYVNGFEYHNRAVTTPVDQVPSTD